MDRRQPLRGRAGDARGPAASGTYQDKLYAVPFTSNVQFLWYRKDRVPNPPKTWDEMIQMAEGLGKLGTIEIQGARYEGLTVWFNTLLASAGGQVVDEQGNVKLGEPAVRAAAVMQKLASSSAANPNLSNSMEDTTRLSFQSGNPTFMLNWPYVYPSAKSEVPDIFENMGIARYPAIDSSEPSHVTLGGINLGVSTYSEEPEEAMDATKCLRSQENQLIAAPEGRSAADARGGISGAGDQGRVSGLLELMKETIDDGVPRPVSPAYSDVSLAIQRSLHPPAGMSRSRRLEDEPTVVAEGGLY